MGKPIKVRARIKGDIADVKVLMEHPMETGARVYELYLDVDWEAAGLLVGQQLKPGMKCNVEVILEEIKRILGFPLERINNHLQSDRLARSLPRRSLDNNG